MTTIAPPVLNREAPNRRPARDRHVTEYTELAHTIRELGLLRRRTGWYAMRMAVLATLMLAGGVLVFALGQSWWQLAVAVGLGVLQTQVAFLGHDGGHRQIFTSGKANEWFSRIVGTLVVGLGYQWWMKKHTRHHAAPNQVGKDGDIDLGTLSFTPEQALSRTGFWAWFMKRQGYLFFPLLLVAGLDLHIHSVRLLISRGEVKARYVELALMAVRLIAVPAIMIAFLGWPLGLAFLAIQVAVFGVYMGASFAPNHKGMPIVPKEAKVDFLRRQVLMSRNVSGSTFIPAAMGGLNYQIEHHLFPSMPSVNLKRAQPIVREYCEQRGIKYTETTLFQSYGIVIRYLNRVGLGQNDPFDCPITAQFRSR